MGEGEGFSPDQVAFEEQFEEHLVETLFRAVRESDGKPLIDPPTTDRNPRKLIVLHEGKTTTAWVYIWPLSANLVSPKADRRKLQCFRLNFPRFQRNPDGPTAILGYDREHDVFVSFDMDAIRRRKARPDDVWVPGFVLREAKEQGISFGVRVGDQFIVGCDAERVTPCEIAVAFTPEHFLHALFTAAEWFESSDDEQMVRWMSLAVGCKDPEMLSRAMQAVQADPVRRQKWVKVCQYVRDPSFAKRVKVAYRHTCAATGLQLGLIEAAHILPVSSGYDNDEISNGIALCPTFHEAFDAGIVYLVYRDPGTLVLQVNYRALNHFRFRQMDAQKQLIIEYSNKAIPKKRLPEDLTQWPDPEMIQRGNTLRFVHTR